jgi:hypothetical protein
MCRLILKVGITAAGGFCLKVLGNPPPNGIKFFAVSELLELVKEAELRGFCCGGNP